MMLIKDIKIYPQLKDLNIPTMKDSDATLLIGKGHADLLLHRNFCQGHSGELTAVKTTLGWMQHERRRIRFMYLHVY